MHPVWSAQLLAVGRWVVLPVLAGFGRIVCSGSSAGRLPCEQVFFDQGQHLRFVIVSKPWNSPGAAAGRRPSRPETGGDV